MEKHHMSNATTTKSAKQDTKPSSSDNASLTDAAKELQAKVDAARKQESAEYDAIVTARQAYSKAFVGTGNNVMSRFASEVGSSCNKFGTPEHLPYSTFWFGVLTRGTSYQEQDRLLRVAKANVGLNADGTSKGWTQAEVEKAQASFITANASTSEGKAKAQLKMKAPASIKVQLG